MKHINKITASILLSFTLLSFSVNAFAWGQKGHDIICSIAEANLSNKAKKSIKKILDQHSIVYYSSWMDNMQNFKEYRKAYDSTRTWHYGNVDSGYTYKTMVKNAAGDILTSTTMIIEKLKSKKLDKQTQSYYLKMLIHLIGDMHCPMHAGRLSDRGGNNYQLLWFNQPSNLHSIWDSKMIESARRWAYTEWRDNLNICNKQQIDSITSGTLEEWFLNTTYLANKLYSEVKFNQKLSYDYVANHNQLLENQLLKAGYRLAKILNEIYK